MSLNFSIDSILRHSNVEANPNSTLIGSSLTGLNKLNQTSFLDESTSAFLKRQQLNYLNNNLKNSNTNGTSSSTNSQIINSNQLNETGNSNFLQSQLFYLNNLNRLNNLNKQNSIDDLTINGSSNSTSTNSFASLELNHLTPVLQNQLSQFHNQFQQLNRYNYFNKLYNNDHLSSSNSFKNLHNQNDLFGKQQISLNENGNASMIGGQGSESQCSPLSDKSSEMLLNYDSSESQLSGNNVSINSNSSFRSSLKGMQDKDKDKDVPLCTKCKLHGIRNQVKGHKKNCPKKNCGCKLCTLTDYGKILRGKKSKKSVSAQLAGAAGLASGLNQLNNLNNLDNLNNNMTNLNNHPKAKNLSTIPPVHANAQQAANLLLNMNNLNEKQLTNLNDNCLLTGLQSSTPNSNSNSSCSNISMSTAALANLNKHDLKLSSTNNLNNLNNLNSLNNLNPALTNEQAGFLEKSTIKDYMKIVISILKDKLAQDGLNYEKEISKLKYAVIYLLLTRFEDKAELYNKFVMDS